MLLHMHVHVHVPASKQVHPLPIAMCTLYTPVNCTGFFSFPHMCHEIIPLDPEQARARGGSLATCTLYIIIYFDGWWVIGIPCTSVV